MLNGNIRPSTLEGVKRLATQIKKERGIKHADALDLAARAASCENFRHALHVLPSNDGTQARHMVLLTVYWYDKAKYQSGRETLLVNLSKPILDICSKSDLKVVRGFDTMRMVAADHFVSDMLAGSQSYARDVACKAERSVRFMEHTGLRPFRSRRAAYPGGLPDSKLPNTDHASDWVDPVSGQFILVDEPYGNVPNDDKRQTWAHKHGWLLRKSVWPSMYFPHDCDLYVATDGSRGFDFDALMAKIDAIPKPITQETWTGDSVPSLDVFVSPAAKTPQDRRRAQSKAVVRPQPSATTTPYSSIFGNRKRRPTGALSVEGHVEAGRIIKAVLNSPKRPYSVYRRMNTLRSTLEDWLNLEISHDQLKGHEFFDVYYHEADSEGPYKEAAQSSTGLIRVLGKLKEMLTAAYPDCAPLRKQLRHIDISVSLIDKMSTRTH